MQRYARGHLHECVSKERRMKRYIMYSKYNERYMIAHSNESANFRLAHVFRETELRGFFDNVYRTWGGNGVIGGERGTTVHFDSVRILLVRVCRHS